MRFMTLDRARVVACLIMMITTSLHIFDIQYGFDKTSYISVFLKYIQETGVTILLPLVFALAGAAVRFEMDTKTSHILLLTRAKRLLIPYAIAVSTLVYIGYFIETDGLKDKFGILFGEASPFGIASGMHLGVLVVLFGVIFITQPLLRFLKQRGLQDEVRIITERGIWLFTPIFDLWLADMVLGAVRVFGVRSAGGANVVMLMVAFVYGHFYFGDKEVVSRMKEYKNKALFTGALACFFLIWTSNQHVIPYGLTKQYMSLAALRNIATWCLIMVIMIQVHQPMPKLDPIVKVINPLILSVFILYLPTVTLLCDYIANVYGSGVAGFIIANILSILIIGILLNIKRIAFMLTKKLK